jgi:lipoprotein-releasing system permease protein
MIAAGSLKDTLGDLLVRWEAASLGQRIGIGVGVLALVVVSFVIARRLLSDVRRRYLWLSTGFAALLALGLGAWAHSLPEPRRASFDLSHQLVRVGAALSGTAFVLGFMALALPWVLDRLERRGFVTFVAARHVRAGKSGFLTVISILSIAGVAISSFALCAVVSIMGGFGADLKAKILGNNSHISIDSGGDSAGFGDWDQILDTVRLVPGVRAATPVVAGEAMASSQSNTAGVLVRGVSPESIGQVIDLVQNIEVGKFEYLVHPEQLTALSEDEAIWIGRGGHRYLKGPSAPKDSTRAPSDLTPDVAAVVRQEDSYPGLVLGRELAKTLHVYVGDEVTLIAPVGDLGPMGVMPRTRKFRVAAVFYSGMYEYDSSHAYMELGTAQEFLDLGGAISQIEVKVEREDRAVEIRDQLAHALSGKDLRVRDWKEMNKGLFSALKLEKVVTFIILSIAIVVGSFCIICTLLLMVTEKSKEIAILKAQGASDVGILKIFMTEGLIIGGIGTVFGVVTGLVSCLGLLWFGVRLDPDVYYVDRLPINVDPVDYATVTLCALGITLAATIYPALAASRLRPVEGIRYE